jgi:Bacterial PH domain
VSGAANGVVQQHEHEFEAAHGLPEALPAGEQLLWQGSPHWLGLAQDVFHLNKLALYFGLLLVWRGANVLADGGGPLQAALALAFPLPLAVAALGLVLALAWLTARTTVYTVTSRRVVMRIGIVLSLSFNLPLRQIAAAALRSRGKQRGDIALTLAPGERIAYLHLWPHARPWHLKRTQPMLRALPEVQPVAELLARALAAAAGQAPVRPMITAPAEPAALQPQAARTAHTAQTAQAA